MSQHDGTVANGGGGTVRADINAALAAIFTCQSGASAPSPTWSNQWWVDTSAGIVKQRNDANSAWISRFSLAAVLAELAANNIFTAANIFQGKFALDGIISPAQITADQNNYAPTGHDTANVLRLSTDASRTITGLTAPSAYGVTKWIMNVGGFNLVLSKQNASSTAANRFAIGADITLTPDTSALIWYDMTTSRWRALA